MINAEKHKETKDLMCAFIQARGPSLPVHIARDVKIDPLFASAFLSELFREQRVKMSHLKVGSTALYFLPGQEAQLEQFVQYLNQREQEAQKLLKQHHLIAHDALSPVLQVAITHIPDFAQERTFAGRRFWQYAFLSDTERQVAEAQVQTLTIKEEPKIVVPSPPQHQEALPTQTTPPTPRVTEKVQAVEHKKQKTRQQKSLPSTIPTTLSFTSEPIPHKPLLPFTQTVKTFLETKHFQTIEIRHEDKKSCTFHALKDTITYTLIAKDRKKLQEPDLQEAITLLQSQRTPVILILQSPVDKKGLTLLDPWKNLIQVLSLQ